jgi:NADPH:quinone reductase-like Zn-dependent oxidoreductase
MDVAGVVVAVGSAMTRFGAEDEVYGFGRGSFAEYTAVRESTLDRKPVNLTFEQAAVVPLSAATALQALTDSGHVPAGRTVLVVGVSGAVGSYAVQLACALGLAATGAAVITGGEGGGSFSRLRPGPRQGAASHPGPGGRQGKGQGRHRHLRCPRTQLGPAL